MKQENILTELVSFHNILISLFVAIASINITCLLYVSLVELSIQEYVFVTLIIIITSMVTLTCTITGFLFDRELVNRRSLFLVTMTLGLCYAILLLC